MLATQLILFCIATGLITYISRALFTPASLARLLPLLRLGNHPDIIPAEYSSLVQQSAHLVPAHLLVLVDHLLRSGDPGSAHVETRG